MSHLAGLLAALAISVASGGALLRLLLPPARSIADTTARGALAVGLGLGVSSCLYFVWVVLPLDSPGSLIALEVAVLAAILALARRRRARQAARADSATPAAPSRGAHGAWVLGPVLGAVAAAALYAYWYVYRAQPHGAWDAFAMFNARARFLVRGAEHWMDAFRVSPFFHPDYPVLVPGAVARLWVYAGDEPTLAPALVAFLFATSTVVLLFAVLVQRRGLAAAALATILLCGLRTVQHGNDSLTLLAALQLADVPFAFCMLAAVSLALPPGAGRTTGLAAAGLAASLAAWCKNEGTLFVVVFLGSTSLLALRGGSGARVARRLGAVLAGAAPGLLLVLAYRAFVAPSGEIVSASNTGVLDKILDPGRYLEIVSQVSSAIALHGGGAIVAVVLAVAAIGPRPRSERGESALPVLVVLGMGLGYLAVYVITPHELAWHVLSSKYRLLTQLWPTLLLGAFLLARRPDAAFLRAPQRGPARRDGVSPAPR